MMFAKYFEYYTIIFRGPIFMDTLYTPVLGAADDFVYSEDRTSLSSSLCCTIRNRYCTKRHIAGSFCTLKCVLRNGLNMMLCFTAELCGDYVSRKCPYVDVNVNRKFRL